MLTIERLEPPWAILETPDSPAETVHPEEKIETVRYIISSDLIIEKGRSFQP